MNPRMLTKQVITFPLHYETSKVSTQYFPLRRTWVSDLVSVDLGGRPSILQTEGLRRYNTLSGRYSSYTSPRDQFSVEKLSRSTPRSGILCSVRVTRNRLKHSW